MWIATHVSLTMQLTKTELVGYLELRVGSIAVQVPIRAADPKSEETKALPLASFTTDGDACAILIRGEANTATLEHAVKEAAHDAERHLSRKLLN